MPLMNLKFLSLYFHLKSTYNQFYLSAERETAESPSRSLRKLTDLP